MSDVEITAVRDAHRFDERALLGYLERHVDNFTGPLTVKQFEGGAIKPNLSIDHPEPSLRAAQTAARRVITLCASS